MAITKEWMNNNTNKIFGAGVGIFAGLGAWGAHELDEKVLENHFDWFDTFGGSATAMVVGGVLGAILGLFATYQAGSYVYDKHAVPVHR